MNTALPINSMRFISADTLGMYLLRISPERKAPKIPSRPMKLDIAAEKNITASTKIYCITESLYLRRKYLAILGMSTIEPAMNTASFSMKPSQNRNPPPPSSKAPDRAAIITSAINSDIIDEPTESCTEECFCRPYRPTIG